MTVCRRGFPVRVPDEQRGIREAAVVATTADETFTAAILGVCVLRTWVVSVCVMESIEALHNKDDEQGNN